MIAEETGLGRSTAEKIMRRCDIIRFDGVRRSFVRRSDVEALVRVSDYHLAGRELVRVRRQRDAGVRVPEASSDVSRVPAVGEQAGGV